MSEKWFEWQMKQGEPVVAGDKTITPQSQGLVIRLPIGGLVWNRPVSVLVEQNGRTEEIPVVDVTRTAVLTLAAFGILFPVILRILRGGK